MERQVEVSSRKTRKEAERVVVLVGMRNWREACRVGKPRGKTKNSCALCSRCIGESEVSIELGKGRLIGEMEQGKELGTFLATQEVSVAFPW